ncbi:sigma factor-like helix-turn-helix DNA-binding protein [Vagococcus fluvialis]|uniref:sigma factor-like helix-turn-helix DNA-binding protein n=1 Tax=Vagococcus fluvialis TaxID=2738 RepID=UPI003D0D4FB3
MKCSDFELSVENQFDYLCKLGLANEVKNYYKQIQKLSRQEVTFSEIDQRLINQIPIVDTYSTDFYHINLLGMTFPIENELLITAIQQLSEKDKKILMLYYLLDLNDLEIGKILNLERSTINRHRHNTLLLIKKMMEEL